MAKKNNKKLLLWLFAILLFGYLFMYGGGHGWFGNTTQTFITETTNNAGQTSTSSNAQTPTSPTQPTLSEEDKEAVSNIQWCKFFGTCKEPAEETPMVTTVIPDVNVPVIIEDEPTFSWCALFGTCKEAEPITVPDAITPASNIPLSPTTPTSPAATVNLATCTDTDGGFNLYVKGIASYFVNNQLSQQGADSCQYDLTGPRRLLESYCVDGQIVQSNGYCPDGYGCWDGICQSFKRCSTITPVQESDCTQFGGDSCQYKYDLFSRSGGCSLQ